MTRLEFLAGLSAMTVSSPLLAQAQQNVPVIGFLNNGSPDAYQGLVDMFRQGWLKEAMRKVAVCPSNIDGLEATMTVFPVWPRTLSSCLLP